MRPAGESPTAVTPGLGNEGKDYLSDDFITMQYDISVVAIFYKI
jgi:hypothetical protein